MNRFIIFLFMIFMLSNSLLGDDFRMSSKLNKKIQTLKLLKLTEELDLTEEQTAEIFPLVKKHRTKLFKFYKHKEKLIDSLDFLIKTKRIDRKVCDRIIKSIEETEYDIREEIDNFHEEIENILTYEQYIKYLVFEERFPRKLRQYLHDLRCKMRE